METLAGEIERARQQLVAGPGVERHVAIVVHTYQGLTFARAGICLQRRRIDSKRHIKTTTIGVGLDGATSHANGNSACGHAEDCALLDPIRQTCLAGWRTDRGTITRFPDQGSLTFSHRH